MTRRLLLINPAAQGRDVGGLATMEPLGLAYVAACTPDRWETTIVDEVMGDRWDGLQPDIVGITALTKTACRAYEVASYWRDKGVPVVLGGIHPSLCPDEAARYADTVYRGEAEGGWSRVIADFESGGLQARYSAERGDLAGLPVPRRDLYRHKYRVSMISASRGCPHRCDFCAIWKFSGEHRKRPIDDVLAELPTVTNGYITLFADDNIYADRAYALELFSRMKESRLNRRYAVQAGLGIADDDELLRALRASGCLAVMIGFESISDRSLRSMRKGVNLKLGADKYADKIATIHRHGLMVAGTFILGCDGDETDAFEKTAAFVLTSGLDIAHMGLLVPTPGTDVFQRLRDESRLLYTSFPGDYARYDVNRALFRPLAMSPEQAELGLANACRRVTSWPSLGRRAWRTLVSTRRPMAAVMAAAWSRSSVYGRASLD